jgi:hypothetical protein
MPLGDINTRMSLGVKSNLSKNIFLVRKYLMIKYFKPIISKNKQLCVLSARENAID